VEVVEEVVEEGGKVVKKKVVKKVPEAKVEVGPKLHPSCNPPQGSWNASIGGCECAGEWYGENCEKKHCADFNAETGAPDCSKRQAWVTSQGP